MLGIYFSGTGNSRYALEVFLKELDEDFALLAIEDENLVEQLNNHDEIVFSYPVQYSAVPTILRCGKGKRFSLLLPWRYLAEMVQEY